MMSLYDYLGRAAGSALGEQVAKKATGMGVKIETRYVKNPAYERLLYWVNEFHPR